MTVSAHNRWGWGGADDGVKSTAARLDMLIRSAGGDRNVLLNVGPRPDGMIDPEQTSRLKDIGAWLAKNGESIYGTRGGPWKPTKAIASTRKGNVIYLHALNLSNPTLTLPPLPRKIKSATVLNGGKVDFKQTDQAGEITLPAHHPDPVDTVIKLELAGSAMDIPAVNAPPDVKVSASNGLQGK